MSILRIVVVGGGPSFTTLVTMLLSQGFGDRRGGCLVGTPEDMMPFVLRRTYDDWFQGLLLEDRSFLKNKMSNFSVSRSALLARKRKRESRRHDVQSFARFSTARSRNSKRNGSRRK